MLSLVANFCRVQLLNLVSCCYWTVLMQMSLMNILCVEKSYKKITFSGCENFQIWSSLAVQHVLYHQNTLICILYMHQHIQSVHQFIINKNKWRSVRVQQKQMKISGFDCCWFCISWWFAGIRWDFHSFTLLFWFVALRWFWKMFCTCFVESSSSQRKSTKWGLKKHGCACLCGFSLQWQEKIVQLHILERFSYKDNKSDPCEYFGLG